MGDKVASAGLRPITPGAAEGGLGLQYMGLILLLNLATSFPEADLYDTLYRHVQVVPHVWVWGGMVKVGWFCLLDLPVTAPGGNRQPRGFDELSRLPNMSYICHITKDLNVVQRVALQYYKIGVIAFLELTRQGGLRP